MLKNICNVLIPPLLVIVAFLYGGRWWGTVALLVVVAVLLFMRRTDYWMLRGNRCLKKGEEKKAFEFFEKALQTNKLSPNYKLYYAFVCLRHDRVEKAQRLYSMVLNSKPSESIALEAKNGYAMYLWKTGQLQEAIETMEEVFDKLKNTATYGRLGFLYIEVGDFEKAIPFNQEAYEYNDTDPSIVDNLALCHLQEGKVDEAVALYEKLMRSNCRLPVVYYNYGCALERQGKLEEAAENLRIAASFQFSALASVPKETVELKLAQVEARLEGNGHGQA